MAAPKAFEPPRDHPILVRDENGQFQQNVDTRWWTFFNELQRSSNGSIDINQELIDAVYAWLGPTVSNLLSQIVGSDKDLRDIEQVVASLLGEIGRLNALVDKMGSDRAIQFKSAAYQILDGDSGVVADASGGDFDITLPDPAKNKDKDFFVQNAGGSGNVTVLPFSGESISGSSSAIIVGGPSPYDSFIFKSDGTDWVIT